MRSFFLNAVVTLKSRPEIGILSSITSALMDHTNTIQMVGMLLGILIGITTLTLKVIELIEKLKSRK